LATSLARGQRVPVLLHGPAPRFDVTVLAAASTTLKVGRICPSMLPIISPSGYADKMVQLVK